VSQNSYKAHFYAQLNITAKCLNTGAECSFSQ